MKLTLEDIGRLARVARFSPNDFGRVHVQIREIDRGGPMPYLVEVSLDIGNREEAHLQAATDCNDPR